MRCVPSITGKEQIFRVLRSGLLTHDTITIVAEIHALMIMIVKVLLSNGF
jgi:hypothetical protein